MTHASSGSVPFKKTEDIVGVIDTHYIVQDRSEIQDFKRTGILDFTTDASTILFNIVAQVNESTGKVSISDICLIDNSTETETTPAIVDFSQVS